MRAFVPVLFMLAALLSPAMAAGPCTEITTPVGKRVGHGTKGYEPVVVVVRIPVAKGKDVEAEAQKAFVRFWIAGRDGNLRIDDQRAIDTIHQCRFLFTQGSHSEINDKIFLRVRMLVDEHGAQPDAYSLRAGIYLPKALVAKQPTVETESSDGVTLHGTWSKMRYTYKLPVTVKGKKGTRTVKLVEKTTVVTQLLLQSQ